jgi:phosphoglycerate kinase
MKCIHEISPEFLIGKKILLRTDFNVPLSNRGKILEASRIDVALKTITYLRNSGSQIILISHIGREQDETLKPVFEYLKNKIPVSFIDTWDEKEIRQKTSSLKNGEIILLENLRAKKEEEQNEPYFASFLASLADVYVNDAFSVSHRSHASIIGVPALLKSYCGCQFKVEYENLSRVFQPKQPFVVLIGGAKFETKIPVIESLLDKADSIFVGGALANDILKATGYEVGRSKVGDLNKEYIQNILKNKKIIFVEDVKVKSFPFTKNKKLNELTIEDKIIDGGVKTAQILQQKIKEAKFIVWNGPFGTFEQGNSFLSTKVISAIMDSNSYSIVGGGDTVAEIKKLKKEKAFDFISLSGGAMLEFIAKGTLVGIDAL